MTITEMNTPIAEGITAIIKEKGLKQFYVAEKAGYGKDEFNGMLNGRKIIKASDIPRIAEALGVTANDIYASGAREGAQAGGNPSGESIAG